MKIPEIIDIHGHLGDILYQNGGELIKKTNIKYPRSFWQWLLCEKNLYRETFLYKTVNKIFPFWSVKSERRRNRAATLENLKISLEGTNIVKCVCAPVAPNVKFEDILNASKIESRIIAFTSPDFTRADTLEKLEKDLKNGAAGVKIHPIIQEIDADSKIVRSVLEIIQKYSKPVLFHTGPANYYLPRENKKQFTDYASVKKIGLLAADFPFVNFIAGHAGLDDYKTIIGIMQKYKNIYADTSFQYPDSIRELITASGKERVMFASDWHYGRRKPAIFAVIEACRGDCEVLKSVFYENAANLLGI